MDDDVLTADMEGAVAQYGETLLFLGFNLGDSQLQITVYPGYRFPGDDRVHGHIGIFDAALGARWSDILERVDQIVEDAVRNARRCSSLRAAQSRARGSGRGAGYDRGPDHIAERFRESWAAIGLRLAGEGCVVRGDVTLSGHPDGPFLAEWDGRPYTVRVYDSGSALVLPGDHRAEIARLDARRQ
jgi:hypothetical protein